MRHTSSLESSIRSMTESVRVRYFLGLVTAFEMPITGSASKRASMTMYSMALAVTISMRRMNQGYNSPPRTSLMIIDHLVELEAVLPNLVDVVGVFAIIADLVVDYTS